MKAENLAFDVTPKVVPANETSVITIRPLFDHSRFNDNLQYRVSYYPCEEISEKSGWPEKGEQTLQPTNGELRIAQYFEGEQEHVLVVEEVDGENRRQVGAFRVYSVEADMYGRRPWKGDFHIHSYRSDGRQSPAYVSGACRRVGLDFMAVTDHHRYAPSLEAIRAFENIDHDLKIYPGEEVHPPENPIHIVNFGGKFSVNELFKDEETYRAEVRALEETLPELATGTSRYQYASSLWCFNKIREAGGLGIFCHPYWFYQQRYTPAGALTTSLFNHQPFDAYEVIGGYHKHEMDSNTLQVARYNEERAKGLKLPIVGVSDAHGCDHGELFGWYYTIVFSASTELSDLRESIGELYSVAVEAMAGESPRAYGPLRLVKYALFLMREVLPQHDELCREEGQWMVRHLAGDGSAAAMLKTLKGRCDALYARYWKKESVL
jgi:hypothetical protein